MKALSSTNGAMKLVVAICCNLMLLITKLQADSSSNSEDTSDEDYNILNTFPKKWYTQYTTGYHNMAGGTAQEESDSENESGQTGGNSFGVNDGIIPNKDMETGESSTVIVSITSSDNVTPYRTTKMRTSVDIDDDIDDDDDNDDEGDDDLDNGGDGGDDEDNEIDDEGTGEGGGTVPMTTMKPDMPDCGKGKYFPLLPLSGRHCFVLPENPNVKEQPCKCNSPPPTLPKFPQNFRSLSMPGQVKSSRRRHGDCDIFCICWILSFVGVVIGAVYKVSKNRRTHF